MRPSRLLVVALVAAAVAGLGSHLLEARASLAPVDAVRVDVVAQPAPRDEAKPRRRPGYFWVPGYWSWRADRYVWIAGRYERARRKAYTHVPQTRHDLDGRYQLYQTLPNAARAR